MNPLAPVLCASLPAAACAFAHYFPWRHFFKDGKLPRLYAYASGLLSVLLPATIAALAAAVTVADALKDLALLVRAIDRRNLWPELAWEPEQAAADARRAVARVRRALEVGHAAVTRGAE